MAAYLSQRGEERFGAANGESLQGRCFTCRERQWAPCPPPVDSRPKSFRAPRFRISMHEACRGSNSARRSPALLVRAPAHSRAGTLALCSCTKACSAAMSILWSYKSLWRRHTQAVELLAVVTLPGAALLQKPYPSFFSSRFWSRPSSLNFWSAPSCISWPGFFPVHNAPHTSAICSSMQTSHEAQLCRRRVGGNQTWDGAQFSGMLTHVRSFKPPEMTLFQVYWHSDSSLPHSMKSSAGASLHTWSCLKLAPSLLAGSKSSQHARQKRDSD